MGLIAGNHGMQPESWRSSGQPVLDNGGRQEGGETKRLGEYLIERRQKKGGGGRGCK